MRKVYKKIKGFFNNDKVQTYLIFTVKSAMIILFMFLLLLCLMFIGDKRNDINVLDTNNIVANTSNLSQVNTLETPAYSTKNLAVPDIKDKEYLGDEVYELDSFTNYNVYTGVYTINGIVPQYGIILNFVNNDFVNNDISVTAKYLGGTISNSIEILSLDPYVYWGYISTNDVSISKNVKSNNINLSVAYSTTFNNYQFKLQIEKGITATDYHVPLQPYLRHEQAISYEFGREDGYEEGYQKGYGKGYEEGYQKGLKEGGIQMDDFQRGYERGREDYGKYFPPKSPNGMEGWYGFQDGYDLGLDEGYQKGYDKGFPEGQASDFGFTTLLSSIFVGMGSFLAINILPGISIGAIVAVPIVFGIIYFIIGRKKE